MNTDLNSTIWNKRKVFAVLLAVFLGPSTWLYTHRKDAWKASLGLGVTLSLIVAGVTMYIGRMKFLATNPEGIYEGYEIMFWLIFSLPILFGTWLWAVIDTGSKKEDWFISGYTKRSKKVAVFLAICVGPWAWLYTYSHDAWKFWLGLVICYGFIICNVITGAQYYMPIWLAGSLAVWIFSVINSAKRDNDYYEEVSIGYVERAARRADKRINPMAIIVWSLVVTVFLGGIIVNQLEKSPAEGTLDWYWQKAEESLIEGRGAENRGQHNEAELYFREAVRYLDEGIKLERFNSKFLFSRAYTYAKLGENELALKDYSMCIILDPQSPSIYYSRSLIYEQMGMNELAIADLKKCISLTNERNLVEIYEGRIESIRARGK